MFEKIFRWLGHPKTWVPGLIVAAVLLIFLGIGGYGYYQIEYNPKFCVSCHTMREPFQKWHEGTHAMVNCHECHKQSKLDSLHQLWMYVTERPDKVVHHPSLDHKICVQCHMTQEQNWHNIEETAGHQIHFKKAGIECLVCHGQGIHNIARPVNVCITCHSDKEGMENKMAFIHCTQCHNFLAKGKGEEGIWPTRENCLNCHGKMGMDVKGHRGLDPNEDCIRCHNPHVK
ncbi:MAG: NapC/NirT family cytochrome c [Deltaproteobacteria bacterium]|nr:NapC/NirT family cytochrome c [Deltaproteobacteria bacterium]